LRFCPTSRIVRALGVQPPDGVEHLAHDDRRQAEARLVEHQHARPGHQCPGDRHHLLLAPGHAAGDLTGALLDHGEQLVHAFQRLREAPAGGLAIGAEFQVLAHGELWPQLPTFGYQGDAQFGPAVRRHLQEGAALEGDVSPRDREQPGDGAQGRRLAGAVGADQGHHLALAYLEAQSV
jgi:hypothetical protein